MGQGTNEQRVFMQWRPWSLRVRDKVRNGPRDELAELFVRENDEAEMRSKIFRKTLHTYESDP